MKKITLVAAAVAMAVSMTAEVNAAANDTARINASIAATISIGGSQGGSESGSGSSGPNDPGTDPGSNSTGGTIGGIAYGQTQTAAGGPSAFWASGHWLIHSNTQRNKFACAGTDLYKGGQNPASGNDYNTLPIPLDTAAGATITASLSQDESGGNGAAAHNVALNAENGWVFKQTQFVNFHANTQEPTQWVSCKMHWINDDPEKAQGDYVGFVRVYAMNL